MISGSAESCGLERREFGEEADNDLLSEPSASTCFMEGVRFMFIAWLDPSATWPCPW